LIERVDRLEELISELEQPSLVVDSEGRPVEHRPEGFAPFALELNVDRISLLATTGQPSSTTKATIVPGLRSPASKILC